MANELRIIITTNARKAAGDMDKYAKSTGKAGKQTKELKDGLGGLKTIIGGIGFALAARQALRFGKEAIDLNSKLKTLRVSFDNMAGGAEAGAVNLEKLRVAAKGTITDLELMKQKNLATTLGITSGFEQLIKISRAAAKSTGQDFKFMLDSLVRGLGRQSPLILDNLGIKVVATADKAEFMNRVLAEGAKIIADSGEDYVTASEKLDQLATSWDNAKANVGSFFAVLLEGSGIVGFLTKTIDGLNERAQLEKMAKGGDQIASLTLEMEKLDEMLLKIKGSLFGGDFLQGGVIFTEEGVEAELERIAILISKLEGVRAVKAKQQAEDKATELALEEAAEKVTKAQEKADKLAAKAAKSAAAKKRKEEEAEAIRHFEAMEALEAAEEQAFDDFAIAQASLRDKEVIAEFEKEVAITEKLKEETEKRIELQRQTFDSSINLANSILAFDQQTSALKIQNLIAEGRAKEDLSEAETARIQESINREFRAQQDSRRVQALLSGFAAAARAFADFPLPVSILMAAAAGVQTAIQVRNINSQKPPTFATGGAIDGPGTATSDSILTRLSNGEYVLRAFAVDRIGKNRLDFMNAHGKLPGFAHGGMISNNNSRTSTNNDNRQQNFTFNQPISAMQLKSVLMQGQKNRQLKWQADKSGGVVLV